MIFKIAILPRALLNSPKPRHSVVRHFETEALPDSQQGHALNQVIEPFPIRADQLTSPAMIAGVLAQ